MDSVSQAYIDGVKKACADRSVDTDALLKYAATTPDMSSSATKGQGVNRMYGAEGNSTNQALSGAQNSTKTQPGEPAPANHGNIADLMRRSGNTEYGVSKAESEKLQAERIAANQPLPRPAFT